jgi:hypothetical protein
MNVIVTFNTHPLSACRYPFTSLVALFRSGLVAWGQTFVRRCQNCARSKITVCTTVLAATNKCLAQSNKTRTGFPANKKRENQGAHVASVGSIHDVISPWLGFGEMITVLKQLSIAATVLLASSGVGHAQETRSSEELRKQRLRYCLEEAYSDYHNAWVDACFSKPGGSSNGTDCKLPGRIADRLKDNLNTEQNFCFQKSATGVL